MCIRILLLLTFIIQACTQDSTQVRKYIFATVFDSILLTGNMEEVKSNQIIQWSFIDRLQKSLMLFHSVGVDSPSLSPYYQHRCKYNPTNGTLELQRLELADSGIYQLSVEHYYEHSPDKLYIYSLYLDVEGIQFLHKHVLVTSVVSLISTSMSLAATVFIIFYSLKKYKAHKYQSRMTIVFIIIEMKSYVCLLISSILCILDSDIFVLYRVISGFVICHLFGMTGYIAFFYLHPFREELASFLVYKRERNIILGTAIFNVIISPLPIYEASLNGANWPAISQHFLLSALAVQWVLKSRQGVRDFSHRVLKQ
ncbi:uncharacterized protein LOC144602629 isoform X4 [Rhinoraja longicauda]